MRMRVVIVDEKSNNASLHHGYVAKLEGCDPIYFTDSLLTLYYCQSNSVDLVILDQTMPVLSGVEFLSQFRRFSPTIPVLMLSSDASIEACHSALHAGANDYLNKPVNEVEFAARISNMLTSRRAQMRLEHQVINAKDKLRAQEEETIFCLAKAVEYRDPETGGHILRMSHYCKHIAQNLGLSDYEQDLILRASPMHDVGKVATPDMILLKPGRLSKDEISIIKLHAEYGYNVLKTCTSELLKVAAIIAYTHHEKFDGSGYPRGLAGAEIPLYGRITAVADVFDALTSDRPYKKAWSIDRALKMIKDNSGKHFDPACIDAFLKSFERVLDIKRKFTDSNDFSHNSINIELMMV